ncbi:MAG: threonine ammonia-lyase [Promethearchaeota archaeon]
MKKYDPIPIEEIKAAHKRISDTIVRTPLVKLNSYEAPAEIYLKLENLQPIGSFKIRGASNAMKIAKPEDLKDGVWTTSGGNHGQGVAYNARKLGVDCTIIAPESAAQTKIDAMERMGARVIRQPLVNLEQWRRFFEPNSYPEMKGLFIHPFSDPAVMAGQGTIGLEILEDLPNVDTVVIPWGGGGLSCGIASAIRALKPKVKLYGCEPETANALSSAFKMGKPTDVDFTPSFIDSAGSAFVWPEMWDLAKRLLDGSLVVGLRETVSAIRLLADRNRIIAEGASAMPVAASLAGKAGSGKIACVVSGGSIDLETLVKIFQGKIP